MQEMNYFNLKWLNDNSPMGLKTEEKTQILELLER